MNPKEKAFELYFKYYRDVLANSEKAKKCALIAVNEVLGLLLLSQAEINYWQEVKQELEKL